MSGERVDDERRSRIQDVDTKVSHEIVNLSIIVGEWNIAMVQLRTSQNTFLNPERPRVEVQLVTVPIFICAASYSYGAIESTAKRNAAYIVKVASTWLGSTLGNRDERVNFACLKGVEEPLPFAPSPSCSVLPANTEQHRGQG